VLSATFYVTAIILCYTKNVCKICNCKPNPESKFPSEYTGVTVIQFDQHLKKLFKKYKVVSILWNTVYSFIDKQMIVVPSGIGSRPVSWTTVLIG